MKTPVRVTKRRRSRAGPTDTARSNFEQTDRADNEGMTVRAKKSSTDMRTVLLPAETTTLERRVLAHERILQSLIAHMTETDPRFLERLRETYRIQIKYHEQDYTDTEDFAEAFVRAIEDAVLQQHNKANSQASAAKQVRATSEIQETEVARAKLDRFQIINRNGIWEIKRDGRFFGDYFSEESAQKAVRTAKQNQ